MSAPWWGCIGVSVSKSMSGVCSSNMVTMSVREGLLCPAFWVLSVSMVMSVWGGGVPDVGLLVSRSLWGWEVGCPSGDGGLL